MNSEDLVQSNNDHPKTVRLSDQILRSVASCHAFGLAICITLLAAIGWVWQNSPRFADDDQHSDAQISKALTLIAQSNDIRQLNSSLMSQTSSYQEDAHAINGWLPQEVNWDQQVSVLTEIAQQAGVQLEDVDKHSPHSGIRVATVDSTCRVQGTFANICKFLSRLPENGSPIWCESIRIDRYPNAAGGVDAKLSNLCVATISLRTPFRGKNTIADKLTMLEAGNES